MKRENTSVLIGFGGDTMLGRLVNKKISQAGYTYPWGDLLPLLKETDLNILNLETALTNSERKVEKVFNFKADPDKVEVLVQGKIDIVNLANNHVLDFSEEGLRETLEVLDKAGIKHVGAGINEQEASRPVILKIKGVRIAILGYTDNEPEWIAGSAPGINFVEVGDLDRLKKDLGKLKGLADFIIVSYHWGPNMREKPVKNFIEFAHALIDMGVDVIHGHSAHIFQGVETYQNGLIMYDTGEFIDDYAVDAYLRNDLSFFFLCEVGISGLRKLKLIPLRIRNMQVNIAGREDRSWSIERMKELSAELGTNFLEMEELQLDLSEI